MTMTLEDLADHEEIRQAIYRHFRAGDRLDTALLATCWWEDGVYEGGPIDGPVLEKLPAFFADSFRDAFSVTNHYLMNMVIDLRGDDAIVECYAITYHVIQANVETLKGVAGPAKFAELEGDLSRPHELVVGIRYSIRMAQRHGVWKIAVMKLVVDWRNLAPYTGWSTGGMLDAVRGRGTRDRTDPSYAWLAPADDRCLE